MITGYSRGAARASLVVSLIFIAFTISAGRAFPEAIRLAATGQSTCYNSAGVQVFCNGTGQDGEFRAGRAWPDPRFAINSDGCTITDNLTGLMWARYGKITSCTQTWQVALASVNSLFWCNYGDWRPANLNELESLSHAGQSDLLSWLVTSGFSQLQRTPYFSSTSYLDGLQGGGSAWSMVMQDGSSLGQPKLNAQCIRLVRGGYTTQVPARVAQTGQTRCYDILNQIIPCPLTGEDAEYEAGASWVDLDPRFIDNPDGTVLDQFTTLMWTKDTATPGPDTGPLPLCAAGAPKTWQEALDYVKQCLNSADNPFLGYRDWRLPNKNELMSLIDRSQNSPALPSDHPFTNVMTTGGTYPQLGGHWSSTNSLRTRTAAWVIDMTAGDAIGYGKTGDLHVWPVRGNYPLLTVTSTDSSGGPGAGTVSKSPPGKPCLAYGTVCTPPEWPSNSARYNRGTVVTLTPRPDAKSVFSGWSGGGGCPDPEHPFICTVAITQDASVIATFTSQPALFTITNRVLHGRQPLSIGVIALSGANADQFSISASADHCSNQTLQATQSCTFKVIFQPTTTGIKNGQIDISSTSVPVQSTTVLIRGTGG